MLFDSVSLSFTQEGTTRLLFSDLTLSVPAGAVTAVMGPSGCGKTSLLRLMAGLQLPDRGRIVRGAQDDVSFVFQENRLFSHLTALENVNVVLSDRSATRTEAAEWLDKVELSETAALYPGELSGGMKRRVALARGLCRKSGLLLLDEPYAGLDDALHRRMLTLTGDVRRGKTTILVTHDAGDLAICDYVLTLTGVPGESPILSKK